MRSHVKKLRYVALFTLMLCLLTLSVLPGSAAAAPPLEIEGKSAVLIDFATGQVLYEKNPTEPIPPASMTKLMTLHLAYKKIAEGTMKPTDLVNVTTDAWAAKFPGSSLMFLAPGQKVTVAEVMRGIAVPSGNDAATALAQHMAGTVDAFVAQMNKEADALGLKLYFADPSGLSPKSSVNARDFATFARFYLQQHPESLAELHSVKSFAYPQWENLSPEEKAGKSQATHKPIEQDNRNGLLWTMEGVDGLKTGFIDEAGYNITVTAKRGDMRLIGVVMGVPGVNTSDGSARREAAAAALLNWGFQNFTTVKPPLGTVDPVRVWKGAANEVALEPEQPLVLTVARGLETKLTRTVHQEASVTAPVKKGAKLGELVYAADGKEIARVPLVAANDVGQGGIFKRLWDSIRLTVSGWFSKKK